MSFTLCTLNKIKSKVDICFILKVIDTSIGNAGLHFVEYFVHEIRRVISYAHFCNLKFNVTLV